MDSCTVKGHIADKTSMTLTYVKTRIYFCARDEKMEDARKALSASQLFGGLPEADLAAIEKIAAVKHFDKGEMIFFEGDEGIGFYLVALGRVSVFKLAPDGREQTLHLVKEGDAIGAVPVFSGKSFPANARALTQCRLIFIPREKFIQLIADKPLLTMNLLALLATRLREFTIQVENLSLKEIPSRLAAYLLYLSREQGGSDLIGLSVTKGQLASLLGAGPESLSRALGSLKARGLVAEDGEGIRLINRTLLTELAESGRDFR